MKAVFNDVVIAESDDTVYLEGNHYFPSESVDQRYLRPSAMRSLCFWKGIASYYTIEVPWHRSSNAAWTYRHPFPWIRKIRGRLAFWNGVEVTE
jgi:uncharacterized protein (DUF427 family)